MQFSELGVHIHFSLIRVHVSVHDDMGRGQLQVGNFRAERPETGKAILNEFQTNLFSTYNVFPLCESNSSK
jgi:hypothetical protein